jgi:fructosamine-3-kinase
MDITVKSWLGELLASTTGLPPEGWKFNPVSGGSINETWQIRSASGNSYFCKIHKRSDLPDLFITESNGLRRLAETGYFVLPRVLACDHRDDLQVLVLEWVREGIRTEKFWEVFGARLALLHAINAPYFGLDEDNYMGSFRQSNLLSVEWTDFLRERRLEPQVHLALDSGSINNREVRQFERLYNRLQEIYPPEASSLLHGDLWSGNFICNEDGIPVLIDPAIYFGHRSMDIGMTTLFGGFSQRFYESYEYHFPVSADFRVQCEISRLYPLLIHLNLFGKGYLPEILRTIQQY